MVLRQSITLTVAGLAAGVLLALAATRVVGSMLVNPSPADRATFAAVAVFLCVVAVAASWWPARRATRVDPMSALRSE
jgi:putative ABC transport system permease protein